MIFIYGISIRRGCRVFKLEKSIYFYTSRKTEQALLKQKIKDIAYSRVHYGYRDPYIAETRGIRGESQARLSSLQRTGVTDATQET